IQGRILDDWLNETFSTQQVDIISDTYSLLGIGDYDPAIQSYPFGVESNLAQNLMLNHDHPVFGTGLETPLGISNAIQASDAARNVRIALAHLFNRTQIIHDIYEGGAISIASIVPPGANGFNPLLLPFNYSIEAAKSHMELAGYEYSKLNDTDSDGKYDDYFFTLNILLPVSNKKRLEFGINFSNELDKIGIRVDILTDGDQSSDQIGDFAIIRNRTSSFNDRMSPVPIYSEGGFDTAFLGFPSNFDWDPTDQYKTNEIPPDGRNWINYKNNDLDNLIDRYILETDLTLKYATLGEIQEHMKDDVTMISLISPNIYMVVGCQINGFEPSLLILTDVPRFDKLYFDYNTCPFDDPISDDSELDFNFTLYGGIVIGGILIIAVVSYYYATRRIKKIRPTKEEKEVEAKKYIEQAKKYKEELE
ncbi:MAG: ABC transporter substrate-binding protein, partial [Candidatus Kariarchaeaceae archaeon]